MWMALVAGASAAVAVVAFLAIPWPWGLLTAPALVAWMLLLSRVTGSRSWKRSALLLLGAGGIALGLGVVLSSMLAFLVP
jgi:hypothetical protein